MHAGYCMLYDAAAHAVCCTLHTVCCMLYEPVSAIAVMGFEEYVAFVGIESSLDFIFT
jgi:hypothetical protein